MFTHKWTSRATLSVFRHPPTTNSHPKVPLWPVGGGAALECSGFRMKGLGMRLEVTLGRRFWSPRDPEHGPEGASRHLRFMRWAWLEEGQTLLPSSKSSDAS